MTLIQLSQPSRRLSDGERLEAMIAEFGPLQVVRVALVAAIRSRRRRVARIHVHDLPDHIRRDIGMPPRAEPPGYLRHLY